MFIMYPNRLIIFFALIFAFLSGCSITGPKDSAPQNISIDIHSISDAVPKSEPFSKWGNPKEYEVFGKKYYTLESAKGYVAEGKASWYGTKFHGKRTSSGETYDMYAMTAAHKTLPLPSYVEVQNLENGKKVVVKVNDRGPFHAGRIIDLSYVAALKLGVVGNGTANVRVTAIDVGVSNNVFVQAGSFSDKRNAERLQVKLAQAEIESDIREAVLDAGNQVYRVRIGPFEKHEDVSELLESLEEIGVENAKVLSGNGD